MDLTRLEQIARDSSKTRADLEQMKANAKAKHNAEAEHLLAEILLERFPIHSKKSGGRTPTMATFRGRAEHFESGKEAYLWLVRQFQSFKPSVLADLEVLHIQSHSRSAGMRFARSPVELFPPASRRAGNPSYYSSLAGEWVADTNINHEDKFVALLKLSHVSNLRYPTDWEFRPIGSTAALAKHQEAVVRAREILAALLRAREV